jgi:hypothetical protein
MPGGTMNYENGVVQVSTFGRAPIYILVFILCFTPPRMKIGKRRLIPARKQLLSVSQDDLPIEPIL